MNLKKILFVGASSMAMLFGASMAIMAEEVEQPVVDIDQPENQSVVDTNQPEEDVQQEPSTRIASNTVYVCNLTYELEDETVILEKQVVQQDSDGSSTVSTELNLQYYYYYLPDGYTLNDYEVTGPEYDYNEETDTATVTYSYTVYISKEQMTGTIVYKEITADQYYEYQEGEEPGEYFIENSTTVSTASIDMAKDKATIEAFTNLIPAGYTAAFGYEPDDDDTNVYVFVLSDAEKQKLETQEVTIICDVALYGDNDVNIIVSKEVTGNIATSADLMTLANKAVPDGYKMASLQTVGYSLDTSTYSIKYILLVKVEKTESTNTNTKTSTKKAVVNTGVESVVDYSMSYVTMAAGSLLTVLKKRK